MDRNFNPMESGSMPRFPLPHHIPPSSPPASPPRQRQHSNSISESLSDNSRLQSTIDKSQLLEYSVLRAYPPANASRRRVTPPQPRLVVPPSPPESFIASGTRQYRSGSSATVKTMPRQDEEPDPVPIISSLKGRFSKAFNMRRGTHNRQPSDVEMSPRELDSGKALTPTTLQAQPPQSLPNSANTVNLSAVSTAHTSLYSRTFPVPDTLIEQRGKESTTDNNSSYTVPTYYNGATASRSQDLQGSERSVARQTSVDRERRYDHQDFDVRNGEVRIEIRRLQGKENQQNTLPSSEELFRDVYRECGRGNTPHEGSSSGNAAGEVSFNSLANQSKNSDELADETAQYFEDLGFGGSQVKGTKKALPGNSTEDLEPLASEDKEISVCPPADHSSSLLGDSFMLSSKNQNDHPGDGLSQSQGPGTLARNHTSSSSNVLRSPDSERPSPGRLLTGQTDSSAERSSSIDPNDAAEIVRCLSADVGKRLSVLSSPGSSIRSSSGLGAGFAVVVTADDVGEINNMSGHLISIPDEDEDDASDSDREGGSSLGRRDKGKGRAVSDQGERSTGESNESSKNGIGSSFSNSTQPPGGGLEKKAKVGGQNVWVHPGDERYEFVYRVRSSSPDNQPLLVPFYKSPPQSTFPYRNALISSLPQISVSQQQKDNQKMVDRSVPPPQLSDQQIVDSGETPPSILEKAFIRPVTVGSYTESRIEDINGQRMRLKEVVINKQGVEKKASNTKQKAIQTPGDGAADIMTPTVTLSEFNEASTSSAINSQGDCEESMNETSIAAVDGISPSAATSDLDEPSGFDNQISGIPSSPPELFFVRADQVQESSRPNTGSFYSDNASENTGTSVDNNDISAANLQLQPTESVSQVLEDYRRSLYDPGLSNQNFWRTSMIRQDSTVTRGTDNGEPRIRTAPITKPIIPNTTTGGSNSRGFSRESTYDNAAVLARLMALDIYEGDDPSLRVGGRRVFDVPPTLVKRTHIRPGNERIPPGQSQTSDGNQQDPEYIALQLKYSRALLFLCCLFPPMLIILATGGMDETMAGLTDGRVEQVGTFHKKTALAMGTLVGAACFLVPIVVGIMVARGAL